MSFLVQIFVGKVCVHILFLLSHEDRAEIQISCKHLLRSALGESNISNFCSALWLLTNQICPKSADKWRPCPLDKAKANFLHERNRNNPILKAGDSIWKAGSGSQHLCTDEILLSKVKSCVFKYPATFSKPEVPLSPYYWRGGQLKPQKEMIFGNKRGHNQIQRMWLK